MAAPSPAAAADRPAQPSPGRPGELPLSEKPPSVWVLHDGKPGMASQALGLAKRPGFLRRKTAVDPPPWAGYAAALWWRADAARNEGLPWRRPGPIW